ncbi:hypothetical protein GGH16_001842, partial [Coemansia sp. RSA 560]
RHFGWQRDRRRLCGISVSAARQCVGSSAHVCQHWRAFAAADAALGNSHIVI